MSESNAAEEVVEFYGRPNCVSLFFDTQSEVKLPFTYDVKLGLLSLYEDQLNQAMEDKDKKRAERAIQNQQQLFFRGEAVFGEGMQYLATLERSRQLGIDIKISRAKKIANSVGTLLQKRKLPPINIHINQEEFEILTSDLLRLQEIAVAEDQDDRFDEIQSIFRVLEHQGVREPLNEISPN